MEKTIYTKFPAEKKILVKREFASPLEKVWNAWTDSKILDQWWAPKPWKAVTKSMDFRNGGHWLYYMSGPDGEKIWNKDIYQNIIHMESFEGTDFFCDEDGIENKEFPKMFWKTSFKASENGTTVEVEITFSTEEDLAKIVEMGFEQGFASAHENLDHLLSGQQNS